MTPRPSFLFPLLISLVAAGSAPAPARVRWADTAPVQEALRASGLTEASFDAYVARVAADNLRRVAEGDLDHLVNYLLQSTRITTAPPIEPALSAKRLVEALHPDRRAAFLAGDAQAAPAVPREVAARIDALLRAVETPRQDARLTYFGQLLDAAVASPRDRAAAVAAEYLRVMRFTYEKEFVAQREAAPAAAVADLYRRRGLSTDTAVEAGYVVHLGLAVLKASDPGRRIRRVLIVGPGLDLAPRTALHEATAPESYQPWAVLDAVVALGLAKMEDVEIVAADINPRVVSHLRRAHERPPTLTIAPGLPLDGSLMFSPDYREYVGSVGDIVSGRADAPQRSASGTAARSVSVSPEAAKALRAEPLDVVTERLAGEPFDLIVATNLLPYFDDPQLALALVNIAGMLAPGGVFLHNEQRPVLGTLTSALGLPLQQSRHAVIATVAGAKAPLYDSVFLHVRKPDAP